MKTRHSQRGLSSIAWLLILLVAGFFLTCAFKLGPAYADNIYIREALKSLSEFEKTDRGYAGMSNSDVRRHLSNYFQVNNIRNIKTADVEIDRKADKTLINIDYEVRVPLFYNIDVVMIFKNQFDTNRPAECCNPQSE